MRKGLFRRLWVLLMTAALMWFVPCLQTTSFAATKDKPTTQMSGEVGYGGYYKEDDWVPVTLTIHHLGAAVSAQLKIRVNQVLVSGRRVSGSLTWSVSLPKNGWTKKQIEVPGAALNEGVTITCNRAGKSLAVADVSGNAVSHVALVAVLSNSHQATQFLTGSSTSSNPVLPVSVDPAWLPSSVNLLHGLDAVVASVPTLDGLNAAQQTALQTWVKLGGILLVTGTGDASAAWQPDLPFRSGQPKRVDASSLAEFAQSSTPFHQTLAVEAGSAAPTARLWATANHTPLLASAQVGRGVVWQTTFSPSDPSLLGWTGNPLMWTALFKHSAQTTANGIPGLFNPNGALDLTSVGDALAPLKVPSLRVFAVVFALYIFIIGPVVFFVLRRFHRAHWAWILLPVVSCVTTVGLYVFGGAERPNGLLADGVGVLELTGDGSAESYAVQAFMSPYPGGLDFQMPATTLAIPMSENETVAQDDAVVSYGNHTNVRFRDVGRWHVRYMYTADAGVKQGELKTNLTSAFGLLFGSVTNQTPYLLNQVAIVWQDHMYQIGNLKSGQTVHLDAIAASDSTHWISDYGTYNRELTHGIGRTLGAYLTQFQSEPVSANDRNPEAMLIATTEARTPTLARPLHKQHITSDKTLVLVRQYANVEPGQGEAFP